MKNLYSRFPQEGTYCRCDLVVSDKNIGFPLNLFGSTTGAFVSEVGNECERGWVESEESSL